MMALSSELLGTDGFTPPWHGPAWTKTHGWVQVGADLLLFGAFMAMAACILCYVIRRRDLYFPRLYWLFATFILVCGLLFLVDASLFWQPWYRFSALIKLFAGVAAWTTVVAVVRVLPRAMALPGAMRLNEELRSEVEERKWAEEEVRHLNAALQHRVEELETLLNVLPVGIGIASDRECRHIRANTALHRLLRSSEGGNVSLSAGRAEVPKHFQVYVAGELVPPDQLPMQLAAANDEVIRDMEEEVRFEDGSVLHLLAYAAPLRDGEKKIRGAVGAFIDITTRKQAETERQLIERKMLETQKLESLGVLAGGIAHDFNNLLTGVVGNASLARMQMDPASQLAGHLDQIQQAAMQAGDLCHQLLAYAGKGRFVVEPIDLSLLVRESVFLLQSSISKSAVLSYELAEQLPRVKADASQLRQIVMNLVINASDALEGKAGVIRIQTGRVLADRNDLDHTLGTPELAVGDYVFLEVGDNGCGIPPDKLGRIFEPFFSTKFTGRGLGLAAVLGIIRGHRGGVKVYSEAGKGTTFKVLLPVSTRSDEESHAAAHETSGWRGSGLALVVDDDDSVRGIAVKMMEFLGFEVLQARNGAEALGLFQQHQERIAMVLLDLTMPMMDGEEAFRRIRAIKPEMRVVLMSGFSEQEALQRFLGRGLAGFLQKPFTAELLREKLRAVLA